MKLRRPLLLLAVLILAAALWAGLIRIGWQWPVIRPSLPVAHGPLMVAAFLGAVISLERGVALSLFYAGDGRLPLLYLPALLSGLGGLSLIIGLPSTLSQLLVFLGGIGLVVLFGLILKRHLALHTAVMSLGAVCLAVGNGLWLAGRPLHIVVWWWIGFLVFTIAGERLELSRLTQLTSKQQGWFTALNATFLLGIIAALFWYGSGIRLAGLGLLGIALWLFRYDIARHTIRRSGQPRFAAACMLTGYFWLAAAGLMALVFGGVPAGLRYDAILHAIFLGFVFGMIFGHAPIIFPAIAGVTMRYDSRFYSHLVLLNLTLLLRIVADLIIQPQLRAWGGLLNALVLVLFLVNTGTAVRRQFPGTT